MIFGPSTSAKVEGFDTLTRGFNGDYRTSARFFPNDATMPSLPTRGAFVKFGQDGSGHEYGWRALEPDPLRPTVQIVLSGELRPVDTGLTFENWLLALAHQEPIEGMHSWWRSEPLRIEPVGAVPTSAG